GIRTGTNVGEAKAMCPGHKCVLAHHDLYVDYHERIIAEVAKHTPINKIWSIDEFSSRLPPGRRTPSSATDVARRMKVGIWKNIGEHINCSIGVAPNSLLAKMGTDMQKPDGLVILTQEDLPGRLLDLKLTDIPGIGHNRKRRLQNANIHNMEDFWNISPKHARKIWGSVEGERYWYWLHGYDFERPETGTRTMIGHSRMLDTNLRSAERARLMARRLLVKATYRLRRQGYYAGALYFSARTVSGYRWGGEMKLSPAQDPFTFLQALDRIWDEMMAHFEGGPPLRFKKVAVIFHGLRTKDQITGDLLETSNPAQIKISEKREALASALDALQKKYKKETVWLGVTPGTIAGHVGTKIAFNRVPTQEEF
ncbi:MAG: Y-family DNA polymerase, partial [Alphaproteobacteria bacterium]